MPARARVESDLTIDGVRLTVVAGEPGARILYAYSPPVLVLRGREHETGGLPVGHTPYLSFSDEEARAIYQALGEYYGTQVSDNRLLRQDYDAERRRVDKITDAVIKLAGA